MKVNMVTPWGWKCGIADYVGGLVEALKDRIEVEVIGLEEKASWNPITFYKIAKRANSDCDAIHIQHEYALYGRFIFSGIYAPILYFFLNNNRAVITTLHEIETFEKQGVLGFIRKILRSLVDYFIFRYSDVLHVHTESAKRFLQEKRVPKEKIVTIPLAMFTEPIPMEKDGCKRRLNLKDKTIVTLFGFVHRNKGHDLAIEALSDLDESTVLLIVGEQRNEAYYKDLERRAAKLGLKDQVIFCGYVSREELPVILNATDLALLPYRMITQSSAIDTLVAYRLPVLTSDLPVFKDMKERYDCIETFRMGDMADMKEKIISLTSAPDVANALKTNCESYIRERSPENIIKATLEMYGKVGD